uniref:Uncharacterized protein n=1 Tax=viral metagenome TaxID=1070528 RepID=A0A6C0KFK7_9ZZZZ
MECLLKNIRKEVRLTPHNVLIVLLVLFVVTDTKIPKELATLIDTPIGKGIVIVLAIMLFLQHNIAGAVALVAAYELIRRSQGSSDSGLVKKYVPSENNKMRNLTAMNQFPPTLEEEVVANMVPYVNDGDIPESNFKPILEDLHQATNI